MYQNITDMSNAVQQQSLLEASKGLGEVQRVAVVQQAVHCSH